jgi:two-component system cell cycle response regulator
MPNSPLPADQRNPIEDAAQADAGEQCVLVVDDNEQNLELLQAYLEDLGCEIRAARDGVEALANIEAREPDLILLDVMMPRMSGFQACSRIKANPRTRDIPVVMVTALNEVGDVERAVESGADDFLTKPVNKLELLTRVRSLLRVRQLKRQLDRTLEEVRRLSGNG